MPQAAQLADELIELGYSLPPDVIGGGMCRRLGRPPGRGGIHHNTKRKGLPSLSILRTEHLSYVYSQGTPLRKSP